VPGGRPGFASDRVHNCMSSAVHRASPTGLSRERNRTKSGALLANAKNATIRYPPQERGRSGPHPPGLSAPGLSFGAPAPKGGLSLGPRPKRAATPISCFRSVGPFAFKAWTRAGAASSTISTRTELRVVPRIVRRQHANGSLERVGKERRNAPMPARFGRERTSRAELQRALYPRGSTVGARRASGVARIRQTSVPPLDSTAAALRGA
jgi:hypothetical protein